jgi:predicted lactoylglutathione lyase
VTDLQASIAFYKALGFQQNPQFSDDSAACMVWSEAIYAMLLTHTKWRTFTARPLPPIGTNAVMLSLAVDSRNDVDAMNTAAAAHGGQADVNPVQEQGFMYGRDLADPDGHLWELSGWIPRRLLTLMKKHDEAPSHFGGCQERKHRGRAAQPPGQAHRDDQTAIKVEDGKVEVVSEGSWRYFGG